MAKIMKNLLGKDVSMYKQPSLVSGLTIKDILTLKDYGALSDTELRQITTRVVSAGNKRIKRLEKAFETSSAVESLKRNGGAYFSVRGKSRNEMMEELKRAKSFFRDVGSTVKGVKNFAKNINKFFKSEKSDANYTTDQVAQIKIIFEMIREINPQFADERYREIMTEIATELENNFSFESVKNKMVERCRKLYEQQQRIQSEDVGTGKYFK